MHRLITNAPRGLVVDHINGNTTDNRRENLRVCTQAKNVKHKTVLQCSNKSGYQGVYLGPRGIRLWKAQIKSDGKVIFLGSFHTIEEAHQAYVDASIKYHGEFRSML